MPPRKRSARIAVATHMCERPLPLLGAGSGVGAAITGSGSSGSRHMRHRRQLLLLVRNWTRAHRSHLTTSRESTGARVVAIQVVEDARAGINYKGLTATA